MIPDTDIVIIVGGPVGAALALALRDGDSRVTVLEARAEHGERGSDPRPIALSYGSRLLLERLDAWQALTGAAAVTAINHVHVSQRGGFGRAAISASDAAVPNLGYVVDFLDLFAALSRVAQHAGCDYRSGARATAVAPDGEWRRVDYQQNGVHASLTARLVVIADGGDIDGVSPPKTIAYAQHALTARVSTSLPHNHVAYERFTAEGPLALLPFGDAMALVWTLAPAHAEALKDADGTSFLEALRAAFGKRLGDFNAVAQRASYPLSLRYATQTAVPGMIAIGNAAQTLHPVAGQGFNLGLRDAWELAQELRTIPAQALSDSEHLRQYHAARRMDRGATIAATHGLVRLFSNDFLPLRAMRGAGMTLLGCLPPVRNFMARRLIFGVRG